MTNAKPAYPQDIILLSLVYYCPITGFFISSFSVLLAVDFSGSVVSVLDGDTIEVLNGHHTECIRLSGIDNPEKGQAIGQKAKQAASDLAFGRDVTL